jgi:hypothetical protein
VDQRSIKLLKAVFDHPYSNDHCFLCADRLTIRNRSKEHVIPKWAQDEYCLWNQRLVLPNFTEIPYRQLTIPCCTNCNNVKLARLESRVRKLAKGNYHTAARTPHLLWFQWLAKIYLGLQVRELSLLHDQKKPHGEKLLTADFVRRFSILHFWLQLSAGHVAKHILPASIFVFPTQCPKNPRDQFDLLDDLAGSAIAVRISNIGVIADFLENGLHRKMAAKELRKYKKMPLHPLQFRELACKIFYSARLLNVETELEFFSRGNELGYTWVSKGTGPDGQIQFSRWEQADYAVLLSHYMGWPYEKTFYPPDTVRSVLHDEMANFVYWDIGKDHPKRTDR